MKGTGFRTALALAIIVAAQVFVAEIFAGNCLTYAIASREQDDDWTLDTTLGVPLRIAFSSQVVSGQLSDRVVFLLVENRYCTPDYLRVIFGGLSERYKEKSIEIDIYSDPEMLHRAIERYKRYPEDMHFPDTPEGIELEKRLRGNLYIPKTGWARARYFKRSKDGELFYYKPDPEKIEMVEVMMKPAPTPTYVGDLQADLFLACSLGDLARASALIDRGAKVDLKNNDGETALVLAVAHNRLEIVRLLLAKGAYVDARDQYGQTGLNRALSHGFYEVFRVLIEHNGRC